MAALSLEPIAKWKWNQHMDRTAQQALSELEREAHTRIRIYDRWIGEGRLSHTEATERLESLLTAIKLLRDRPLTDAELMAGDRPPSRAELIAATND